MSDTPHISCCECSQKSLLFKFLNDEELNQISETKSRVFFNSGEIIVKQGAPLSHVLSFTSGIAKVYVESSRGRNLILQFIKPTEFLGGPGIFIDSKHYFSVTALEDSSVCFIDIKVFKSIIRKNADFAEAFMKQISKNGIFNYKRFISLTHKNMHGRIADGLIYLHDNVFNERDHEIVISHQDLAELTGMSKDSVVRTMKDLAKESVIEFKQKSVCVLNMQKLIQISELA